LEIENDSLESKEKIAAVYNAAVDEEDDQFVGYEKAQDFFRARDCSKCETKIKGI
jgi:hypothetical protein